MRTSRWLVVAVCCGAATASAATASAATAPSPDPEADGRVHIQADSLSVKGDNETGPGPDMVADGNVHVRRGTLRLRAPHLEAWRASRHGVLEGGVRGTDGLMVLSGRRLSFDADKHSYTLEHGEVVLKKVVPPVTPMSKQLLADKLLGDLDLPDPSCLFHEGKNALQFRADVIRRDEAGDLDGENVWLTTCACSDGCIPLLSITASSGHVIPHDSATLLWPVFRVFNVPVLPLPWVQFPLSDRRTGLLFPLVNFYGEPQGTNFALPLFVTLGRSADVTVQALYFLGTSNATVGGTTAQSVGVRGPGDEVTFRWRPAVDSSGFLDFFHVYDTSLVNAGSAEARGDREALRLQHSQGLLGGNGGVAVDVVSDANVLADTSASVPRQDQSYLRSWAEYARPLGPIGFSVDSNYIQDLDPIFAACGAGPCLLRTPWNKLPGVEAPVARLSFGNTANAGRLMLSEELSFAYEDAWRVQPEPAGHQHRLIGGLSLGQTLPLVRGRFGSVALEAGERLQGLSNPDLSDAGYRGGGYIGLVARSRIARTYANGWVHDILPSLQVRALDVFGDRAFSDGLYPDRVSPASPLLPQSDLDMALPYRGTVQSIVGLTTNLTPPRSLPITLTVEEHVALAPVDPGQLHGHLGFGFLDNRFSLDAGYDFTLKQLTSARVQWDRNLGGALFQLGAAYLDGSADDQIARGLDVLFTPRGEFPTLPAPLGEPQPIQQQASVYARVDIHLGAVELVVAGSGGPTASITGLIGPNADGRMDFQTVSQDYLAQIAYEAEGCGRLSLSLHWTHVTGQQYAVPIPAPGFTLTQFH